MGSRGRTKTRRRTPSHLDYNIQTTAQGMTQAFRADEHLCRVMDNDGYSRDCVREESRVREWDLENFQVKEMMKVIKEICE
ncbi:hypothetical protein GmHk_18G052392 [Glycine max]|nr:hypothetical protein GmHk_18G052392 [Glycine max]